MRLSITKIRKMFIKDLAFRVEFSMYAESHFCRDFCKKYKGKQWLETKKTIIDTLQRAFLVQQTSLIDVLKYSQEDSIGIFKYDFKIAGTNISPKSSGNRVVFSLCNNTGVIKILLVYSKNHCDKKCTETQWVL
ncbi:MAG: hypothetical protein UT33_C0009G0024 [Candidatus Peregrinibacteria bacterium GW2011_GWC2_39_14]|nr:MAG: hypothetical protein US92_C0005G0024 [Candidatus Peregrinibacteria bacterium GW2011_GWA2_38_36]KKR06573.1 MAG: hypothetical protein UT33_C0009G0024 [Candidatus Peregrinibacteria bacterium GW2011_GWC2_39_14]